MPIVLIGVNHKKASLETREKLSLEAHELKKAVDYLLQFEEIEECFFLFTCNRTELYALCLDNHNLREHFLRFFQDVKKQHLNHSVHQVLYMLEEEEAVQHFFQVASGLDSMVLGETQILGQVKEAYYQCHELGATGSYLHELCQMALSTGKKVHTQTRLGQHAVSFGYAATEIARDLFPSIQNQTMLVVGTGEMAELTLKNLFDLGIKDVIVASRDEKRGENLASRFKGTAINFSRLSEGFEQADVIICATNAPHYVITPDRIQFLHARRHGRPLLIIDLGVPRNVAPEVENMESVYLYNLDDLKFIIEENLKHRQEEAGKARTIIKGQVKDFSRWYRRQRAIPFILSLREKAEALRKEKHEQFGISSLPEKERRQVEKLTASLVNSLIKDSIMAIKDLSLEPGYDDIEPLAYQLLGLAHPEEKHPSLPAKTAPGETCTTKKHG